jgi:hypothetical protein
MLAASDAAAQLPKTRKSRLLLPPPPPTPPPPGREAREDHLRPGDQEAHPPGACSSEAGGDGALVQTSERAGNAGDDGTSGATAFHGAAGWKFKWTWSDDDEGAEEQAVQAAGAGAGAHAAHGALGRAGCCLPGIAAGPANGLTGAGKVQVKMSQAGRQGSDARAVAGASDGLFRHVDRNKATAISQALLSQAAPSQPVLHAAEALLTVRPSRRAAIPQQRTQQPPPPPRATPAPRARPRVPGPACACIPLTRWIAAGLLFIGIIALKYCFDRS